MSQERADRHVRSEQKDIFKKRKQSLQLDNFFDPHDIRETSDDFEEKVREKSLDIKLKNWPSTANLQALGILPDTNLTGENAEARSNRRILL